MQRALLIIILLVCLLAPIDSNSQDNSVEQRISMVGYGLLKGSNELSFIKAELIDARKKNRSLGGLEDLEICYISRLIENISLLEIICKYEGTILGSLPYIDPNHRLQQYKVHQTRLKDYTLKNLYLHYKATRPVNAKLEDRVVLDLTERAKKEVVAVSALIEELIGIFESQGRANP